MIESSKGNCGSCEEPDDADHNMVACGTCETWYHYSCAGVSPGVEKRPWNCHKCLVPPKPPPVPDKGAKKKTSNKPPKKGGSKVGESDKLEVPDITIEKEKGGSGTSIKSSKKGQSDGKSVIVESKSVKSNHSSARVRAQLALQRLEEERELEELKMKEEKARLEEERALKEKERALRAKEIAMREAYLKAKYDLEEKVADDASSQYSVSSGIDRTKNWLKDQKSQQYSEKKTSVGGRTIAESKSRSGSVRSGVKGATEPEVEEEIESNADGGEMRSVPVEEPPRPIPRNPMPGTPRGVGLTADQLTARQIWPKKLPFFSGEPEEWPLFVSSFETANNVCGFSNVENLVRLRECLRGAAREAVATKLMFPQSVPTIIETLRRLYGRPELLVKHLLSKVRRLEAPRPERLDSLINFGMAVQQLCDHLEAASLQSHLANPALLEELVEKLPAAIKLEWVRYKRQCDNSSLKEFGWFMDALVADASEVTTLVQSKLDKAEKSKPREKGQVHTHVESPKPPEDTFERKPCPICGQTNHRVWNCEKFHHMTVEDRFKAVERWKLCRVCLFDHGKWKCRSKIQCNECQGRHHSLLHKAQQARQAVVQAHEQAKGAVIFRVIPVELFNGNRRLKTFAFLDEGSSLTLLEDSLAQELGIEGVAEPLELKWTSNVIRKERNSKRINVEISGCDHGNRYWLKSAHTVDQLNLPKQTLALDEMLRRFDHLRGVPVSSYTDAVPRVLIGLDNIHLSAPQECRKGKLGDPIAVKCSLGWTIYGPNGSASPTRGFLNHHGCGCQADQELNEMVRKQFVLDDVGVSFFQLPESKEDTRAKKILEQTTVWLGGRYETGLLWKEDDIRFPDNWPMALKRLQGLEAKLAKIPELRENVNQQIKEYIQKEYAHKATAEELSKNADHRIWYLPLNIVTHPRKPGKRRLVWDAAAQVDGVSLNTQLLKGPDQLVSLPSVICKFRERRVGFGGDIREMFHQIRIREEDRQAQRFLFRFDVNQPPDVYIMDVATFGATCSPCSAQYVMRKNADEFKLAFPKAVAAIKDRTYMDDYYDSADTPEEAAERVMQVKRIHARAGFDMRNWVSSSKEVLEMLGENASKKPQPIECDKEISERVLGMLWEPDGDAFAFSVSLQDSLAEFILGNRRPTKRAALRCIMSLFDPLGLLSPYIVHGRMLVQDLWRSGLQWDQEMDDETFAKWRRWTSLLPGLSNIKIPRYYFGETASGELAGETATVQLHVFTDASELGYGCVAYFRTEIRGKVECSLVMGRCKVAPLKHQSIPRMELQAAVLGARMLESVCSYHSIKITERYLWTDSSTVLSWIKADHRRYKQFVAHRIGEILSLTRTEEWNWVPTRENVADCLTKWGKDTEPDSNSRWFKGPSFLYLPEEEWPKQKPVLGTSEELRTHYILHHVALPEGIVDATRVSKWEILVRTVALLRRFVSNCRRKMKRQIIETIEAPVAAQRYLLREVKAVKTPLRQDEYLWAERCLWRVAQAENYPDEVKALVKNRDAPADKWINLEKTSALYRLCPFADEFGVLRVEGRTANASYATFDARFPIIMPKNHPITFLLLDFYHRRNGHVNKETAVNEVRQRFEIANLRSTIDKAVKKCVWCKIKKCRPRFPRMAPLPEQRLTPYIRPFSYVGLDYLGPLEVSLGKRKEKRYVAVFTCLVVRAVHLDVAFSLSTPSCKMTIRRFVKKRGSPAEIFSDNGTNFVGASRELSEQIKKTNKECADTFTDARTKWSFNPPSAPHMGGVWERMVRTVKESMEALNDGRKLDDEILLTVLAEVEGSINARPLTYMPQESSSYEALTPNHFIFGNSSGTHESFQIPVNLAQALKDSYSRSQYLANAAWERWLLEYFPTMNKRSKWIDDVKPLEVGDLVYVAEGNRRTWIRGQVEEVIVGKDGRVRQAIVRTATSRLKRPVVKLAVMEISNGGEPGEDSSKDRPASRGGGCSGNPDLNDT